MSKKMLLYTGKQLPDKVIEEWRNFAAEYAHKHQLPMKNDPGLWEVANIIPGMFPAVGALVYQFANQDGNCAKIIIQPGYDDIMRVQERIGKLEGCIESEYTNGMILPLHRHPKLVYHGDNFVGSVVEEHNASGGTLFRVRVIAGNNVESRIYAQAGEDKDVYEANGLIKARHIKTEATIDLTDITASKYPADLRNLSDYNQSDFDPLKSNETAFTIRIGKQETFLGFSETPMYIGSVGEDNLSYYGISLPSGLENNMSSDFRHVETLTQFNDPYRVEGWHWLMANIDTAAVYEVSGMPHLGMGSVDAGDLFPVADKTDDPLYIFNIRPVEEGH